MSRSVLLSVSAQLSANSTTQPPSLPQLHCHKQSHCTGTQCFDYLNSGSNSQHICARCSLCYCCSCFEHLQKPFPLTVPYHCLLLKSAAFSMLCTLSPLGGEQTETEMFSVFIGTADGVVRFHFATKMPPPPVIPASVVKSRSGKRSASLFLSFKDQACSFTPF